ncbi:MAG: DUF2330 domain-containing protein [Actinomycetota bacterium]|nr:DUF2330 domain-containing protein [Actinomycetota bacterium]
MRKAIIATVLIVAGMVLLGAGPALADGGFISKHGRDIYEPEQKGVIFYHEGREELLLSVRYEGAMEEFAWLVPLPEPPQVEESDFTVFELMSELAPTDFEGRVMKSVDNLGHYGNGVEVIEELTVGAFDLTVLKASQAGELREWLNERDFTYDEESEEVFADYIERGWCFVAMKVSPSADEEAEWALSDGTIDPLRFSFAAPRPVYPLYISSLNPGGSEVLLYVLGDEAYSHEDMDLEFADEWQENQLGALEEYSPLAGEMEEAGGCRVTKLRGFFWAEDMRDLYLIPAGEERLDEFEVVASVVSDSGGSFPGWAVPVIIILLATLVTVVTELVRTRPGSWWRVAAIFLASVLVFGAVFVPLSLAGDGDGTTSGDVGWPWKADILLLQNGWEKVLHPDGSMEVTGLSEYLQYIMDPESTGEDAPYDPYDKGQPFELGENGEWTGYVTYGEGGCEMAIESQMGEEARIVLDDPYLYVIDARLSPAGDRLWLLLNREVEGGVTEAREYSFPSPYLERSATHPYRMMVSDIVISAEGYPAVAGRFVEDNMVYVGMLPMLEEGAAFDGKTLRFDWDDYMGGLDEALPAIADDYYCLGRDGSQFLLLHGYDSESYDGTVYVFDTSDGDLYEVARGLPQAWR